MPPKMKSLKSRLKKAAFSSTHGASFTGAPVSSSHHLSSPVSKAIVTKKIAIAIIVKNEDGTCGTANSETSFSSSLNENWDEIKKMISSEFKYDRPAVIKSAHNDKFINSSADFRRACVAWSEAAGVRRQQQLGKLVRDIKGVLGSAGEGEGVGGPGDGTKVILKTLNLNRVFELSQRQANFDGINDDELLQVSERSGGVL